MLEVAALGSSILLAHLLTPAEIGRAVIALIAIPLSTLLLNGVIGPLLIQRPQLERAHLEGAAALALAGGLALGLLTLAAVPLLGWAIDERTGALLALAAPAFLLSGAGVVPDAILRRELRFRPLALIDVAAALAGTALTVGLALGGTGASSLVLGSLAGNAVGSAAVCAVGRCPTPRWHRTETAEIVRFGMPAGLSGLGTLFYRRVDYLLVGARLGAADVGAYWRAYQLGAEYQSKLTTVMLRVAFPLYSRLRDVGEMRRARSRIVRLHAAIVVPPLALLIAVAPVLVPFVYGDAWRATVVPTQLLAGVGMLTALTTGVGPLLMALGRAELLNRFAWASGLGYAVVIYLAAAHGLVAVSVAALAYVVVGFVLSQEILVHRPVGIPWSELIGEAGPSFLVGAAVAAVCAPLAGVLDGAGVPAPATLVAAGALALAIYLALVPRLAPAAWGDLRAVLSRAQRERSTRAGEPAESVPAGTSFSTTEPAPTIAPDPMLTPGPTITPANSSTSSPNVTGAKTWPRPEPPERS